MKPEPPTQLLPEGASGYVIGGIVEQMLVVVAVGLVLGVAVRLLGRRGSWWVAGGVWFYGIITGPVGIIMTSTLIGGFVTGNTVVARRLLQRAPESQEE